MRIDREEETAVNTKKNLTILWKIVLALLITFVVIFTIYMGNFENKLIYYVVRPFLNKHYDAQVRDKRIV